MTRQLNKMLLSEALEIFGFSFDDEITKKTIMKRYRELSLLNHPDKGGNEKVFAKIADAKEVLIREFDAIATTTPGLDGKPVKSVGRIFVDFIKQADLSNIKSPFTTWQRRKQ